MRVPISEYNWDEITEIDKPVFGLFDMTRHDIDNLYIKKFKSSNCFVIDNAGNYYNGFILSKNSRSQTECRIDFFPPKTTGRYIPRPSFQITNISDGSIKESNRGNDRTRRIPFNSEDEGRDRFWKLIQFLLKFKDIVDFGEFDEKYQAMTNDEIAKLINEKNEIKKINEIANNLNVEISSVFRPANTIKILNEYKGVLEGFIKNNANENDVQQWIDENKDKYRSQRCLIFGLEYIDFKREGSVSSKRFDVLTRVGSRNLERVIIELKSPGDNIFAFDESGTKNNPTYEYKLHSQLSRAIPQILEYKRNLEDKKAGDPELEKLGVKDTAHICKCIIVIGKNLDDSRWIKNRMSLLNSLNSSLEIWTYSDLLNKLEATIENLQSNISKEE